MTSVQFVVNLSHLKNENDLQKFMRNELPQIKKLFQSLTPSHSSKPPTASEPVVSSDLSTPPDSTEDFQKALHSISLAMLEERHPSVERKILDGLLTGYLSQPLTEKVNGKKRKRNESSDESQIIEEALTAVESQLRKNLEESKTGSKQILNNLVSPTASKTDRITTTTTTTSTSTNTTTTAIKNSITSSVTASDNNSSNNSTNPEPSPRYIRLLSQPLPSSSLALTEEQKKLLSTDFSATTQSPIHYTTAQQILFNEFPKIPKPFIRHTFIQNNSCLTRTLAALTEISSAPPNANPKAKPLYKELKKVREQEPISLQDQYLCPALLNELWVIEMKKVLEREKRDEELANKLNNLEYEESGQLIDCECCFASFAFDEMTNCLDGHMFCKDCAKKIIPNHFG
eukprot:TRINITY_DN1281_c0_g1_i1.p1 TRINITY_DN1281_c0_g1~~TRINITY_DN1281_c0_g1_i1.p1  ORF type:complete len:425 (-),score=87.05 TRINITY_DN1281_c0_g1_i1:1023-2225(-)